jgi:hypothetical protein
MLRHLRVTRALDGHAARVGARSHRRRLDQQRPREPAHGLSELRFAIAHLQEQEPRQGAALPPGPLRERPVVLASGDVTTWQGVRRVVNWVNLSTPLGLLVAVVGRASVSPSERGTLMATGYRWRIPIATAFTVGNVIVTRHDRAWCSAHPEVLRHEDRHCTQYAFCLGPVMVLLYLVFAAVSWALSGSFASYNPFERLANLADGGYPRPALRFRRNA